jgi:hypothetical protein
VCARFVTNTAEFGPGEMLGHVGALFAFAVILVWASVRRVRNMTMGLIHSTGVDQAQHCKPLGHAPPGPHRTFS